MEGFGKRVANAFAAVETAGGDEASASTSSSDHQLGEFGYGGLSDDFGFPFEEPDVALAFVGDFYQEAQVTRGVTMDLGHTAAPSRGDLWAGDRFWDVDMREDHFPYHDSSPFMSSLSAEREKHGDRAKAATASEQRFPGPAAPPRVPADALFELCDTTLRVRTADPAALANFVLDFLATQVLGPELKVRPEKCSIKFNILFRQVECCIKVKLFDMEDGTFALEVQRRRGDAVTFHEVYAALSAFLADRCNVLDNAPSMPSRPADPWEAKAPAEELAPLTDLAGRFLELPEDIQIELAAACVQSVKASTAIPLWTKPIMAVLQTMLLSQCCFAVCLAQEAIGELTRRCANAAEIQTAGITAGRHAGSGGLLSR